MNIVYVRIRSWHVVAGERTRCGRKHASTVLVDYLPANEKSCETCLRLVARDVDNAQ